MDAAGNLIVCSETGQTICGPSDDGYTIICNERAGIYTLLNGKDGSKADLSQWASAVGNVFDMDANGAAAFPGEFYLASPFSNGYAAVQTVCERVSASSWAGNPSLWFC